LKHDPNSIHTAHGWQGQYARVRRWYARVELVAGTHANALQIPIDAVTRLESDQYVYIVQEGKARKVPVALGIQDRQMVEVTRGLTGTEPVIVSGKDLVTDGAKVDPKPMATPAKPAPAPTPGR